MVDFRSVPLLLLLFVASGLHCSVRGDPPSDRHDGTKRMAERLEEIARNVNPATFPWINAERAEYYRRKVETATDLEHSFSARLQLGYELTWAGDPKAAIQEFIGLRRFLELPNVATQPETRRSVREALAMGYMRLGEQENCLARHSADSCLMPIRGSGVHADPRASTAAIQEFTELLQEEPNDLGSRWLLNLAYMTIGGYPDKVPAQWLIPTKTFDSEYSFPRFYDVAPAVGVDVVGHAGGSIMEDFDCDGLLDLMCSSWGLRDQLRYFHNEGDGTFSDHTERAGLKGEVSGLNICHGDYNNDGRPDVFVLRGAWLMEQGLHPDSLLRNNGDGTFSDVTEEAGILSFHPSHSAAWADYDNDGWLDLFVGNESSPEYSHASHLFHNNRDGTFSDVASSVGITALGCIKGVAWGDYNNDGRPDLYLSRHGGTNVLYRNDGPSVEGHWRFTDVSTDAGVTEPLYSFPTWFWDYDNDGWLDIFVAAFGGYGRYSLPEVVADYLGMPPRGEYPRLYRNNRDGTFTDATKSVHLNRILVTMGANFGDLDNDGYLDFYLGTGEPDLRTLIPNRMFRNADGRFFQDVTTSGGFGHLQKGHGISFGDIDNDGDQDIYAVMGGALAGDVFQNTLFENPGHGNHWITLRLEGVQTNRIAVGARIKVTVNLSGGSKRDIYATVSTGGSFGSSSLQQEIGLGSAASIHEINVTWPTTGKTQTLRGVAMDRIVKVREGDPDVVIVDAKRIRLKGSHDKVGEGNPSPQR